MKENVLDVLMYLFETYVDTEEDPEPDQNELRIELSRAGFGDTEIERALDWLDGLTDHQESLNYGNRPTHGTRIYQRLRARTARCTLSRLYHLSRADRHPVATAARDPGGSPAGAGIDGYRRRADQVGCVDGAVQSTRTGTSLRAHGRPGFRGKRRIMLH